MGTASLRRAAQLLAIRPDLQIVPLRGNVQTRLRKLDAGEVAATFLAVAGLARLGLEDAIAASLDPDEMLPAVAQGVIGIECRDDDAAVRDLLERVNHAESMVRMTAERALLAVLDGSCRTPIAALAEFAGDRLRLRGLVASPDGRRVERLEREGPLGDAVRLGSEAGAALLDRVGPGFLAA